MLKQGVSLILTNNSRKLFLGRYYSAEALTISKKDNYYKNLGTTLEDESRPADWDEALPFEQIPGPKPLPVIGNLLRFLPFGEFYNVDIINFHKRIHKQYGDIAILKGVLGHLDMVFLYNPLDMEKMLRNEGAWPIRKGIPSFVHYRTETRKDVFKGVGGVLTVQGEEWFKFRSTVNPILMQPRIAQQYTSSLDLVVNQFLDNMRHFASLNEYGEMPEDFANELNKWALESIGVISLDKHLGCLKRGLSKDSESQKHINSVISMFDMMYQLDVLPSPWKWISTPTWRKYVKVMDYLTEVNMKHIEDTLQKIENSPDKPEHEMSALQRMVKKDKKVAIAMVLDMMIAGVDTTSRTMGAALYFLAKNTDKQLKLREEAMRLLPRKDSPVTKETISQCSYTKAVIKETTRIAPVAVGNLRTTVKDIVLGGYQIPKGTEVITSHIEISNSEKYFPEANKFMPERWLRSTTDEYSHKHIHPFVYLPFGFGPRSCIGKRLANLELEVGLLKIARNFDLSWARKDMAFKSTLLYGIADPLKLRLKELNK